MHSTASEYLSRISFQAFLNWLLDFKRNHCNIDDHLECIEAQIDELAKPSSCDSNETMTHDMFRISNIPTKNMFFREPDSLVPRPYIPQHLNIYRVYHSRLFWIDRNVSWEYFASCHQFPC
jgi:hypothetical protein